jgi:hypothetical protein
VPGGEPGASPSEGNGSSPAPPRETPQVEPQGTEAPSGKDEPPQPGGA